MYTHVSAGVSPREVCPLFGFGVPFRDPDPPGGVNLSLPVSLFFLSLCSLPLFLSDSPILSLLLSLILHSLHPLSLYGKFVQGVGRGNRVSFNRLG
jgi:hypothetical protein